MSDHEDCSNTSGHIYRKLRADGTVDSTPVNQSDYDMVNRYIKGVFPKASRVQKEIEQTLKRTFVLGRTDRLKKKNNTPKLSSNDPSSSIVSRKIRIRLQKKLPENLKYDDFVPLNLLWKAYIVDLLKDEKRPTEIQARMNRADFHGALITVCHSNCVSYTGLKGIVLHETKNTFVMVTSSNKTKTIPKPENVFSIELENPEGTVQIAGNSFVTRPAERSNKKIKSFMDFISHKVYKFHLKNNSL